MDDGGLLFCLVNADVLGYDVSQQAVRSLEMLTQGRQSKYGLEHNNCWDEFFYSGIL